MIAAILRAQMLSMRIGGRRGAIFSAITGFLWYGFWSAAAVAAYVVTSLAGPVQLHTYLPMGFLGVCAYWQVIPVLSASMGAGLDMRKLLVYPLPHGQLFVVEILLRLTAGAEMIMVLTGGSLGLLSNPAAGGWTALPRVAGGALSFVVFNLLLASGMRSLLERLLTRRKVREVLSFLLLMLYVMPRVMFYQGGSRPHAIRGVGSALQAVGLPWTAAARLALGETEWLALAALGIWALIAFWFGRAQFERNLRYDAVAAQATPLAAKVPKSERWTERFYRLPGAFLTDPLAAIVEKELRTLSRAPRFRMVFVMGFTFGLAVWLPTIVGRHSDAPSSGSQYFLVVVCVYALTLMGQVSYWNCFGFDRSAAGIYFAAPQPMALTLAGKNVASLFFIYLEVLILTGVTMALRLGVTWGKVAETLVVVGVCSLYMLALGNVSSVNYPRGLSPERVSQGGASSRFQGLVFLLYPLALVPVFLAYLARYAFESDTVFAIVLAIAAVIGGVLYWVAMDSAVATASKRREQILQELAKGDGPVAAE